MTDRRQLPPFPVDETTLGMLMAALDPRGHGDPDAERSSVGDFLTLMSQLGGSDTEAVAGVTEDGVYMMRDQRYHEHCVIAALVEEVRRLRTDLEQARHSGEWWMNVSGNTAHAWGEERKVHKLGAALMPVFKAAQRLKEVYSSAGHWKPHWSWPPRLEDAVESVVSAADDVDPVGTGVTDGEQEHGTFWEHAVLKRFVDGGPVDLETVRTQVGTLLDEFDHLKPKGDRSSPSLGDCDREKDARR